MHMRENMPIGRIFYINCERASNVSLTVMTLCQATLRLVVLIALTVTAQEHCHGERRNAGYGGGSESASTSSFSGSSRGRTDNAGGLGGTDRGHITIEYQSEYYGFRIRLRRSRSSCNEDERQGAERNYERPGLGDSGGPETGDTDTNPETSINMNLILIMNVKSHVSTQSPTQTQTQTEAQTKTETHTETSTQTHTETETITEQEPDP